MTAPDDIASPREEEPPDSPAAIAHRLAFALSQPGLGTGPLAELRRLDPDGALAEPALHRLLARHVPPERLGGQGAPQGEGHAAAPEAGQKALRDWALIIHCLALAAPGQLQGEARLGRALQQAGLKEQRFTRLLEASPRELRDLLPRAIRFLVHRGGRLQGAGLAQLVLSARHPQWGERVRQALARDYYRAEYEAGAAASAE